MVRLRHRKRRAAGVINQARIAPKTSLGGTTTGGRIWAQKMKRELMDASLLF